MQTNLAEWQAILLCVVALAIFIRVYGRMLLHIQDRGGEVRAKVLQQPDTLVTLVLMFFFAAPLINAITKSAAATPPEAVPAAGNSINILFSSLMMGVIPFVIVSFMVFREVRVETLFGLKRMRLGRVLVNALALLLAALPAVFLCGMLTQQLLGENAESQPLVELFHKAKETGDFNTLWQIAVSAVVVAPLVEEIVFRGYFYPALKRHIGGVHSAWITAFLFGAIHGNLLSFPGLTVLAFALTIAFERTGSLLVCIGMHAGFNALSLLAMWNMNPTP